MKTELECGESGQATPFPTRPGRADCVPGRTERTGDRPQRLLMVEDATDFAEMLGDCLGARGVEVALAADGAAALRLLERGAYDVVLMDIDLPDISGFEVVARAGAAGHLRGARIIFCTGTRAAERLPLALNFWGSSFLEKPFKLDRLLDTIAEVMAAAQPELQPAEHARNAINVITSEHQP